MDERSLSGQVRGQMHLVALLSSQAPSQEWVSNLASLWPHVNQSSRVLSRMCAVPSNCAQSQEQSHNLATQWPFISLCDCVLSQTQVVPGNCDPTTEQAVALDDEELVKATIQPSSS